MLCRSCAGPHAGDGCVVCQSPAWVKDIQNSRHLSNITQLFCSLESLLNPTDTTGQQPACGVTSEPAEAPEWDGMPPTPKRTPKRAPSPPGGTPKRPRTSPGP
ncbi:hypothetical protein CRUP_020684, partial [Coryphaenoides rupestris]